jgi:hypothetical protein
MRPFVRDACGIWVSSRNVWSPIFDAVAQFTQVVADLHKLLLAI